LADESDDVDFRALSERQRDVLRLVAEHLHSKEIARRLGISSHTVDTHVFSARERLGAASRRDAALLFVAWEAANGLPNDQRPQSSGRDRGAPRSDSSRIRFVWFRDGRSGRRKDGDSQKQAAGMCAVPIRFILDAIYSSFFMLVISAAAYGAHLLVQLAEGRHVDGTVVAILHGVTIALVAIDGIGVVSASGIMMYRFLVLLTRADG